MTRASVLAGFPDGLATEGPTAGEASLRGLRLVREAQASGEVQDEGEPETPFEHVTHPAAPSEQVARDVQRQAQSRSGSDAPQQTAESDPAHPAAPGHDDAQPEDVRPEDVRPESAEGEA